MERKTKHRILGILVVIGLVIILLPLFQSEKETPAEATLVQAPPFPDQPAQTEATPASDPSQVQTPQSSDMTTPQNPPLQNPSQDNGMTPSPDDTVNPDSATQNPDQQNDTAPAPITNEPTKQDVSPETPSLPTPDTSTNDNVKQVPQPEPGDAVSGSDDSTNLSKQPSATIYRNSDTLENKAKEAAEKVMMTSAALPEDKPSVKPTHRVKTANAKKSSHKIFSQTKSKKHNASLAQSPLEDDGLFKLKSSVWVIQMGSFKNKSNAIRLVNNLRSKGYPAFIQQIASSTRVFVGPSAKQTSARTLASKIKSETQMDGIVISYKPLSI